MMRKKDTVPLIDFLKRDEWRTVGFTSRIKDNIAFRWSGRHHFAVLLNEMKSTGPEAIAEAVLLTRNGLIVPILSDGQPFTLDRCDQMRILLQRFSLRLHSIMGPRDSVIKMERLFSAKAYAKIDYHLMVRTLNRENGRPVPPLSNLMVSRAGPEDSERLFSLQKAYEIEEVCLDPSHFNESVSRILFKNNLRKQIIFFTEAGGLPVAKAGTNARGFNVDQIGGVFTKSGFRRNGIATYLMKVLLEYLSVEKKAVTLFVKRDNPSALALYRKLEFEERGSYRITYYYRLYPGPLTPESNRIQ